MNQLEDTLRAALRTESAHLDQPATDAYSGVMETVATRRRRRRVIAAAGAAVVVAGAVAIGGSMLRAPGPEALTPGGPSVTVPESVTGPASGPAEPAFTEGLGGTIVVRSCADPAVPWATSCAPDWAQTAGQKMVRMAVADVFEVHVNDVVVEVLFDADLPTDALPEGSSGHAIIYHATLPDNRQVRATEILVHARDGGAHQPPILEEVSSPALPVVHFDQRHDNLTPPLVISPDASALTLTHPSGDRLIEVEPIAAGFYRLNWLLSVPPDWTVLDDSEFTVTLDNGTQQSIAGTEVMDGRVVRRAG